MSNIAQDAAKAIADKAERSLARLKEGDRKAADKRRQAAAMVQIAARLGARPEHAARAAELGNVEPTAADLQAAAGEVYSLATRRESAATTADARAKPKPDWVRGGDDFGMPIHPERLREAIALFDIALSLHQESFWGYTKGLLQERLGDFAGAVHTFETLGGLYAQHAPQHLLRCRAKLAGSWDPEAAVDAAFAGLVDQARKSGHPDAKALSDALAMIREIGGAAGDLADEDEDEADDDEEFDADDGETDLAALIAQTFAELLVEGDFKGARGMLSKELKSLRAADLESAFKEMIGQEDADELAEELEVCVMSCDKDLPDMRPEDVGMVYVAINGDGFSEAVTVMVTHEKDELRIRELEWGRP